MLGFDDEIITIEKCIGKDLRGIPQYASPSTAYGYAVEKITYNYQTGEASTYLFIALQEPYLVEKEDKVNGFRVETVKNVFIDGEFIVCEVTAK